MNKLFRVIPLGALVLSLSSWTHGAEEPATAVEKTCRHMVSGSEAGKTYCGTVEQWAEFDRRVALANLEAACRSVSGRNESCIAAAAPQRDGRSLQRLGEPMMPSEEMRQSLADQTYQMGQMQETQQMVDQAQAAFAAPPQ
jgi:hypothetical protein